MRAARIRVAGALHQREPSFVEYVQQSAETRMQAERPARRIGADL